MDEPRAARLHLAWTAALVVGGALAFYLPALAHTGGLFPAPLDDVYIHFGLARSAALGHPFEWIPGNGYTSGGTSLLYPLVLAPGHLFGLHGERLGWFAAAVACAALVDLGVSLRALTRWAPRWVAFVAPALLGSVGVLAWSFYSGMEVALLAALMGRTTRAAARAADAPPEARRRAQRTFGLWAALAVATRPEACAVVAPFAVAVAFEGRSFAAHASLARAGGPALALVLAQAAANVALTGAWAPASVVLKSLVSNPFATPIEVGRDVAVNLAVLRIQVFDIALGGAPWSFAPYLLAAGTLLERRARPLGVALLAGSAAATLLVAFSSTARFQNFRYAAPGLVALLFAAALGLAALARRRRLAGAAALLSFAAIAASARRLPAQIEHFARASGNIAGQQVEVARRLSARAPAGARVLVGDAGAIPYLSGMGEIDGLGLGGFRRMPFARAAVHGPPAVVELLERLPPRDRPTLLALYPSWWRGLADEFGRPVDAVRIEGNVICAASEKVIYEADWSALDGGGAGRAGALFAVDVADVLSERELDVAIPAPRGGWTVTRVLRDAHGARRFDAGRIVPPARELSFAVPRGVARGPAAVVVRVEARERCEIEVKVGRAEGASATAPTSPPEGDAWGELIATVELQGGDRVALRAVSRPCTLFHAWVLRAP